MKPPKMLYWCMIAGNAYTSMCDAKKESQYQCCSKCDKPEYALVEKRRKK
jgi:hypothetical protein